MLQENDYSEKFIAIDPFSWTNLILIESPWMCNIEHAVLQANNHLFSVSILYIGWDKHYSFRLYYTSPRSL